jgi:hypothetical protein
MTMDVEALIARDARRVLDNPERPPTADLSLGLRTLLQRHLPSPVFEALLQPTLRIRSDHRLEIRGLMAWEGCVELFGADLQLAEDRDALADYVLYFGRQGLPGRRVATEQRGEILPELRTAGEWAWAHVFRKIPTPKSQRNPESQT